MQYRIYNPDIKDLTATVNGQLMRFPSKQFVVVEELVGYFLNHNFPFLECCPITKEVKVGAAVKKLAKPKKGGKK
jgi:hypothetical protein